MLLNTDLGRRTTPKVTNVLLGKDLEQISVYVPNVPSSLTPSHEVLGLSPRGLCSWEGRQGVSKASPVSEPVGSQWDLIIF